VLAEQVVREGEVVEIRRQFQVGREALFHAWTEPDALKMWFGPDGVETRAAEVDLCIGGRYRFELHLPDGAVVEHWGEYQEIVPSEKLVFTWILQDQACEGSSGEHLETRVTVLFRELAEQTTELYLLHEGLPTKKSRDGHTLGWNGCLDGLRIHFAATNSGD